MGVARHSCGLLSAGVCFGDTLVIMFWVPRKTTIDLEFEWGIVRSLA